MVSKAQGLYHEERALYEEHTGWPAFSSGISYIHSSSFGVVGLYCFLYCSVGYLLLDTSFRHWRLCLWFRGRIDGSGVWDCHYYHLFYYYSYIRLGVYFALSCNFLLHLFSSLLSMHWEASCLCLVWLGT